MSVAVPTVSNGIAGATVLVVIKGKSDQQHISYKIRLMMSDILELSLDKVAFVNSSIIPRATSGKIDRS